MDETRRPDEPAVEALHPGDPADEALRRAEAAWRSVAPAGGTAAPLWRHGRRMWELLRGAGGLREPRAVAVAAALHEIGWYVRDRGHVAVRGARWTAAHLDDILASSSPDERRLVGELILFHRHRGPLPAGLLDAEAVERFRSVEALDRRGGGRGAEAEALARARAAFPRGGLGASLWLLGARERLRHPVLAGRARRIRRPDH